jgi:hypothetical protein
MDHKSRRLHYAIPVLLLKKFTLEFGICRNKFKRLQLADENASTLARNIKSFIETLEIIFTLDKLTELCS